MQTGCNVKKQRRTHFFFMLPWQGQQVNCNSWKPLGDRLELRVMCRFKKNKTKPMLHANIAAGLIQKNHCCLNYEPNSAYNLLVSRVLMNYFMREESIFRCYMFNLHSYRCQNTLIWSKRFINVQSDICKNNHEAVDYSYSSTVDNRLRSGNFALRLIGAISQSVYSSVIKLVHYLIQNMYGNVLKAFY